MCVVGIVEGSVPPYVALLLEVAALEAKLLPVVNEFSGPPDLLIAQEEDVTVARSDLEVEVGVLRDGR